jgi:two-component system sensor histidine kinase CpxA
VKLFIPLYARIFAWFCLNLLLIAGIMLAALHAQFGLSWASLLQGPAGDRAQAVAGLVGAKLSTLPPRDWDALLTQGQRDFGMTMRLYLANGRQLAGPRLDPPDEVARRLRLGGGSANPAQPPAPAPPMADNPMPRMSAPMAMMHTMRHHTAFFLRTTDPVRYWVGVPIPVGRGLFMQPLPATLVMSADSFVGIVRFLDLMPLAEIVLAILLLSALLWWPLVHGISRTLKRLVNATDAIAEGRMDTRVTVRRRDELGQIGEAINQMAVRLGHFMTHQKRFLGDVAHELCSPLARMQLAAGILKDQGETDQQPALRDLQEDLDVMSELVNDLLAFSRAALGERRIELQPVDLGALVDEVIRREAGDMEVSVNVPAGLAVAADSRLLARAMDNIVRNARRHAAGAPLSIAARRDGDLVSIRFTDAGPGIPPDILPRLGEPFLRVDDSRSRDSGGTGLGLAIVKTCMTACGGSVSFARHEPQGLEVTLRLRQANRPTAD